jgi:hypothetical protein
MSNRKSRSRRTTRPRTRRATAAPGTVIPLYDLVCPREGDLGTGLEFNACWNLAHKHNAESPNHHADCFAERPAGTP